MAKDYPRAHRIADFIQREISQLIRSELKDPRVSPMLTVASVDVSSDLSIAKIYYTIMDDSDRGETQKALASASGYLRRRLAANMNTRSVPNLRFYYDDSAERGAQISALIDEAVSTNTTPPEETASDTPDSNGET